MEEKDARCFMPFALVYVSFYLYGEGYIVLRTLQDVLLASSDRYEVALG